MLTKTKQIVNIRNWQLKKQRKKVSVDIADRSLLIKFGLNGRTDDGRSRHESSFADSQVDLKSLISRYETDYTCILHHFKNYRKKWKIEI